MLGKIDKTTKRYAKRTLLIPSHEECIANKLWPRPNW